ncbi:hypothetical protein BKA64DRAFT_631966 [Cadophora sp. MPI-SDFR-AT-0126]|nr:hypothetical protein BKA64DRAFT_631966 [Leotiomycetes sp. MPI-SDFR-AT-0126]
MKTSEKISGWSEELDMSRGSSTSALQNIMPSPQKYQFLSGQDNEDAFPEVGQATRTIVSWWARRTVLCLVLPIFILAIVVALYKLPSKTTAGNKKVWQNCGNSTSEAREQGCRFDVMMHSWVPAPCYDEQLSEEYIQANGFKFFSDPEATVEVPMEVVRRGEFEMLYTGLSHHVLHCTYIWRLLSLSVTEGRPFDSLSSSEDHTGHCSAILLHGLPWTKPFFGNESVLSPDFLSCGYY